MVEEEKRKEGEEEQGEIKKSEPFPTSFKFNESRNPGSDDNPIVIQALCFPRSGYHLTELKPKDIAKNLKKFLGVPVRFEHIPPNIGSVIRVWEDHEGMHAEMAIHPVNSFDTPHLKAYMRMVHGGVLSSHLPCTSVAFCCNPDPHNKKFVLSITPREISIVYKGKLDTHLKEVKFSANQKMSGTNPAVENASEDVVPSALEKYLQSDTAGVKLSADGSIIESNSKVMEETDRKLMEVCKFSKEDLQNLSPEFRTRMWDNFQNSTKLYCVKAINAVELKNKEYTSEQKKGKTAVDFSNKYFSMKGATGLSKATDVEQAVENLFSFIQKLEVQVQALHSEKQVLLSGRNAGDSMDNFMNSVTKEFSGSKRQRVEEEEEAPPTKGKKSVEGLLTKELSAPGRVFPKSFTKELSEADSDVLDLLDAIMADDLSELARSNDIKVIVNNKTK